MLHAHLFDTGFLVEGLDALAERAIGRDPQQQYHAQRQDNLGEHLHRKAAGRQ